MKRLIHVVLLLNLTACGEVADDDSLDGLTPNCTPGANGIACADDPSHPVTYRGPGYVGGVACNVIATPAHGYLDCED